MVLGLIPVSGLAETASRTPVLAPADSVRARDRRLAHEEEIALSPAEARGDIPFTIDTATFLDEEGQHRLDGFLRIPHTRLEWIRSGPRYRAELEFELEVSDRRGRQSRTLRFPMVLSAESFEETRRVDAHALRTVTAELDFVPYRAKARLSDLRSTKATLLGKIRDTKKHSEIEVLITPEPPAGQHRLSSLVFATAAPVADSSEVAPEVALHGGRAIRPNPTHFVGHENELFPVYFEAYRLDASGGFMLGGFEPRVRYRILDTDGVEVLRADDSFTGADGRAARVQRFTVKGFPTGTYILAVELLSAEGEILDLEYGDFHVLWSERSWIQNEKEILDEARVLLTPAEFDRFESLPAGEREAYMAGLWRSVDPSPANHENERRTEFEARIRDAEVRYGGLEGGKLSDRGRIFVRYGPPDEVVRVRIPQRTELSEVVADELRGSMGGIVDVTDPRLQQLMTESFFDNADAEIWKYFGGGDPILSEHRGPAGGMAFILVDEQGVGFYRLVYSNVIGIM
jgi:GWxTD domain-containing protein